MNNSESSNNSDDLLDILHILLKNDTYSNIAKNLNVAAGNFAVRWVELLKKNYKIVGF